MVGQDQVVTDDVEEPVVEYKRPSEKQVGGSHYKHFKIQPSFFCEQNKMSHLESNAVKYICRASTGAKDSVQDLLKAKHCIDMILEWRYSYVDHPDTARP